MAPTPEQLRRLASAAKARAELLLRQAEVYRRAADELEGLKVYDRALREHDRAPTVGNVFADPQAHRLNSSAGKSDDPLLVAARAARPKPFTLRGLAEAIGLSAATLSMARKGTRSIRRDKAQQIEQLTGFAATPKNWPGGIAD